MRRKVDGFSAARREIILGLAFSASALAGWAQGQNFSEFPVPTQGAAPYVITAGPDGNLWFTEYDRNQIGRITTSGVVTEFLIPTNGSQPAAITAGPDGNLWFVERANQNVGRITPDGVITEFPTPTANSRPWGIAAGPDGNLWITEQDVNLIGRVTPSGVITEFPIPTASSGPLGIAVGPDGNLWFGETFANNVGRITPTGQVTEFPIPTTKAGPWGITAGPDGNVWFVEYPGNQVGRVTPAGVITEFPIPTELAYPFGITTGPDGNLWFTENIGGKIGRVTPAGVITETSLPSPASQPYGITTGPDGNLWFTESVTNQIARMSSTPPAPCIADSSTLCLNGGRFEVRVSWSVPPEGRSGTGTAVSLTDDTGYFWFFDADNVELVTKVLDGQQLNGSFWVFYGALSSAQYTITIRDSVTGAVKTYQNAYGNLASVADTTAFTPAGAGAVEGSPAASPKLVARRSADELSGLFASLTGKATPKAASAGCTPDGLTLCLNQSRFQVRVDWEVPSEGRSGHANAVPITNDTGYLWFFDGNNVELVVKVLDGQAINGHFWVFYGALSNVQYTITVTDTETQVVKTYTNPSGTLASVADTTAF